MTTMRLSAADMLVIENNVLEYFRGAETTRIHVGTIKQLRAETDRKGNHMLWVDLGHREDEAVDEQAPIEIPDQVWSDISGFVATVEAAMAAFRPDCE